jgi:hypothetical protein
LIRTDVGAPLFHQHLYCSKERGEEGGEGEGEEEGELKKEEGGKRRGIEVR